MNLNDVIQELEPFSNERTKKSHMSEGAVEPVYGLTVKSMKPVAKRLLKQEDCQQIAYALYDTGNYDLMYLAGMIIDPHIMSEEKYDEWMEKSYFYMIADYVIAVSLSETDFASHIANKWINSGDDLKMSAGYSTYSWMLSRRKDNDFDVNSIKSMLDFILINIEDSPNRTQYSMYYCVYNVGLSYRPLHAEALGIAKLIGDIEYTNHRGKTKLYNAENDIMKQVDKGRLGFKRKYVRC
jgi:hypothetical protein